MSDCAHAPGEPLAAPRPHLSAEGPLVVHSPSVHLARVAEGDGVHAPCAEKGGGTTERGARWGDSIAGTEKRSCTAPRATATTRTLEFLSVMASGYG